jgi:hypothetical protein
VPTTAPIAPQSRPGPPPGKQKHKPPATPRKPRTQWGRDRRTQSLPIVPAPVSDRRIALGRLAVIVTVTAWLGYFFDWLLRDLLNPRYSSAVARTETISYLLIGRSPGPTSR